MTSKHALWWQAYTAALASGSPQVGSSAHDRATAIADLGIAELEKRIAADVDVEPEEKATETAAEKSERAKRLAEKRDETLFWSARG